MAVNKTTKLLHAAKISELFPPVQFAFYGNHIDRYKYKVTKKTTPKLDIILAVEDVQEFHSQNLKLNKDHYTMMNRATRNRVLNYFQSKGAKVHFNYGIKMDDEELSQQTGEKQELVDVRYGVISFENLARDLTHWETMLVSTMMQRPIKTIVKNDQIWEHQMKNLKSALALAALRTQNGSQEAQLYEQIVSIPHYTAKYMHSLVDKEDEVEVVKDNFVRFQQMYQPIWQTQFKDCFSLEGGKFEIEQNDATFIALLKQLKIIQRSLSWA